MDKVMILEGNNIILKSVRKKIMTKFVNKR